MHEDILICGLNWLGDCVMSMPAIQTFKQRHPACRLSLLTKEKLASLWEAHAAIDSVIAYDGTNRGTFGVAREIEGCNFACAYVFPNSFRAALIPWLARVPRRVGVGGHARGALLTERPCMEHSAVCEHQQREYFRIMGIDTASFSPPLPLLALPEQSVAAATAMLGGNGRDRVGLFPGAARGPSKRWSEQNFIQTGQVLVRRGDCEVVLFGSADEADLCGRIAAGIGVAAVNLAGRTSLVELAASLSLCRVVVANDSGGMHLAAATGTPVVAVFGLTDPRKTGPLGRDHTVLCAAAGNPSRDIARASAQAAAALNSIAAARVIEAVLQRLGAGRTSD